MFVVRNKTQAEARSREDGEPTYGHSGGHDHGRQGKRRNYEPGCVVRKGSMKEGKNGW